MVKERSKKINIEDWEELEKIAFSMIRMCLANQVIPEVSIMTMAKGLWEKLEKMYMSKSMTYKLWLNK